MIDTEGLSTYDYCHKRMFNYCRLNGYSKTNTWQVYKAILKRTLEKHYAIHSPTYLRDVVSPLTQKAA